MTRTLLLSMSLLLPVGQAALADEANFNLYIRNVDSNYDAYISGNEANRQNIGYAPGFSNTPLPRNGGQVSGPFNFSNAEGWADYAFSPYCGNEHNNNAVRVTLRANQNGTCNGQTQSQNPPNNYTQIMSNTRGFFTCVEVSKSNGAKITAKGGTDIDGTPKITLELQYDREPVKFLPAESCVPGSDYCVIFRNTATGDRYLDGRYEVRMGDGPSLTHRRLLPQNGQLAASYKWISSHIGQGGSKGAFMVRNECNGEVAGNFSLFFNTHDCRNGIKFLVRNVFTKSGSQVGACATSESSKIELSVDQNGLGVNKPIITAKLVD